MPELEHKHKKIYNLYLKHLALKNNRPYQQRKNFEDLDSIIVNNLLKLGLFFDRNPEIDIDLYFKIGFLQNPDTYLKIDYFLTLNALKKYSNYIRMRYNIDIDSVESIEDFKSGLYFILKFLKENNVKLNDYHLHKNSSGVYTFLIHLKQQKISLYHLHCFDIKLSEINLPNEILNIFLEDFKNKFYQTKHSYKFSKKLKAVGDIVTKKLNKLETN